VNHFKTIRCKCDAFGQAVLNFSSKLGSFSARKFLIAIAAFNTLFFRNSGLFTAFNERKMLGESLPSSVSLGDNQDDNSFKGVNVKVEYEACETLVLVVPPDTSTLLPIHKLIAVDLWSDDKKIVEEAFSQLADLCCNNENVKENRTNILRTGGASSIVGAMRRWYMVPEIQAQGCRALANASIGSDSFRRLANEVGAFVVIVCAMENYPNHCFLQYMGCIVLMNLCAGIKDHGATAVDTMKGYGVIIAKLKKFSDEDVLLKWARYAVSTFRRLEGLQHLTRPQGT
jgi:hypothetical protein